MEKQDIIALHPKVFNGFPCPKCGERSAEAVSTYWPGIHVMASYKCRSCEARFERDLPIGFANDHPLAVDLDNGRLYNTTEAPEWLVEPFTNNYHNRLSEEVIVKKTVYRECDEVVILNCLDFLYGHVLLKLYNAQHYLDMHPDKGLIIIAPKMYSWMIPQGIAEYWEVHLGLGRLQSWRDSFDRFVQAELPRFNTVYLGRGYSHPEFHKVDISRYVDVKPFPLEHFTERELHVTFVARQDRLWFRSPLGKFVYRVLNKLGLKKSLGSYFLRAQDRMIGKVMQRIRRQIPGATFSVVGLGKSRFKPETAQDLRTTNMNADVEMEWCRAYGKSQLVIGVHGSNMLLPTAFAAGCVEILPHDRNGNIVQDISVKYTDRMQLFLYRFVDEFASPAIVARTAVSMYKDYPVFHNNNRINIF